MQKIVKFYDTLTSWKFPWHLFGSAAFIGCAFRAIQREAKGESWGVMELCDEWARENPGWTQWATWRHIQDTLKRSKGPKRPGDAIRALVKAVKE